MESNAEVIAVMPNKIRIRVGDIKNFNDTGEKFSVGSYLRVSDSEDCAIIAMIENNRGCQRQLPRYENTLW